MKGESPGYIPGDHWAVCDVCGVEFRQSQLKETWDNKVVCKKDYESRHPQDFVRAKDESPQAKGIVRSEPADEFVSDTPSWDRTDNHHTVPTGNF